MYMSICCQSDIYRYKILMSFYSDNTINLFEGSEIINILMGSDNSKLYVEREIPQEFRQISERPDIFENFLTGTRLQRQYIHFSSQSQLEYQKDIFFFRRMHSDLFLNSHYFENTNKQNFCSSSYEICYFIELPSHPFTINDRMKTQNAFKLLIECLKGFSLLFHKFGPFRISSKHICYDSNKNVKVWISPNLLASRIQPSSQTQHQMIQQTFDVFDSIRDEKGVLMNFNAYLCRFRQKNLKPVSFDKIINYLISQASKFFQVRCQKKCTEFSKRQEKSNLAPHTVSLKQRNNKPSSCIKMAANKSQGIKNNSCSSYNVTKQKNQSPQSEKTSIKKVHRVHSQENYQAKQNLMSTNYSQFRNSQQDRKIQAKVCLAKNIHEKRQQESQIVNSARVNTSRPDKVTFFYQKQGNLMKMETVRNEEGRNRSPLFNGNYSSGFPTSYSSMGNYSCSNKTDSLISNGQKNMSFRDKIVSKSRNDPLAQLKTIKSIHNYDAFQIDHKFILDLERMDVNAESTVR